MDDDAFKAWFSLAVGASPAAVATMRGASLPRVLLESAKFRDHTIALVERGPIEYLDGVKEMDGIVLPKDRLTRFMIRVVKGLLCHHEPTFDYSSDQFTVKHLAIAHHNLDLLAPFQAKSVFESRGEGVVRYRRLIDHQKHYGLWLITFFESTNLLVHHAREVPRLAQSVAVHCASEDAS